MINFGTSIAQAQENEKLVQDVAKAVGDINAAYKKLPTVPATQFNLNFTNTWNLFYDRVQELTGYYIDKKTYGMMSDEQRRELMLMQGRIPEFRAGLAKVLASATAKTVSKGPIKIETFQPQPPSLASCDGAPLGATVNLPLSAGWMVALGAVGLGLGIFIAAKLR